MSDAPPVTDPDRDDSPREECGVFAVAAPAGRDVSRLAYYALHALQHRGQESAGIAARDGEHVTIQRDLGLVSSVFDETSLLSLTGEAAIGHVRYSTTGANKWDNAQPVAHTRGDDIVALGHNGNLTNTGDLRTAMELAGVDLRASTDSEIIAAMIAAEDGSLLRAVCEVMPRLVGAYSVVVLSGSELVAFRDPNGVRPLVLGRLEDGGWCVASETCALDQIGARFERDVRPGEALRLTAGGVESRQALPAATPSLCVFEHIYFARPDSRMDDHTMWEARSAMGRELARESRVEADLVVGLPDSGTPAAIGYAQESGIPYSEAVVRNRYVGRSFIQPDQAMRQVGIRLKFNPLPSVIAGKRLVVVDDSIVRGNTTQRIVQMLMDAGAREVHMRISSPPILWPCFYGIDMADRAELVAVGRTVDQIADLTGADSLAYLSLDGLQRAIGRPAEGYCRACFTGEYPIAVPDSSLKMRFEPGTPPEPAGACAALPDSVATT
ncbi:MAG: amidophosphoribosyltransferase [Thermoleophilia bacterium]